MLCCGLYADGRPELKPLSARVTLRSVVVVRGDLLDRKNVRLRNDGNDFPLHLEQVGVAAWLESVDGIRLDDG